MNRLYDVVAVNLNTKRVRIMDEGKTGDNAEAIVNLAVMRRGVDEEIFATVPHGAYAEGDSWIGAKETPA